MGERHQIFIIARRGKRYRCLAVVHHQWLFGKGALETCKRLLAVFSDPSNRIAIEQELVFSAIDSDKAEANAKGFYEGSPHPFPFIATCLYLGTASDPDVGRLSSRIAVESPSLGYNQGDNNTGITVIDLTDLDQLRYCYVWIGSRNDKPEAAGHYLRRFYDIDSLPEIEDELKYMSALKTLEKVELIPLSSLKDCWPGGRWTSVEETVEQAACEEEQPRKTAPKSLVDMSAKKLIDELVSSGDDADISVLDHPLEIPRLREALLGYCRQNPDTIAKSSFAAKVLAELLDGETRVDLSPYHQMSPDATRSLLKTLKDVRVLNISGTLAASDKEIADTLAAIDHDLDELYILARPDREVDDPMSAVRAIGKQPFTYRKLTLASVLSKPISEWSWMGAEGDTRKPTASSSPELYGLSTSFPVIQILIQGPGMNQPVDYEAYFLGDGFISPARFVGGIINTVRGRVSETYLHRKGISLAHAFASAPSSLKTGCCLEVFVPPAETCCLGRCSEENSLYQDVHSRVRDLTPDAWTAVFIQERRDRRPANGGSYTPPIIWFKVALLRSNKVIRAEQGQKMALEDVEVVDLETFLAKTSPSDVADLKQAMENADLFVDRSRIVREPGTQVIRGMEAAEAVNVVEEVFSRIEGVEKARQNAYRWG